MAALLTPTSRRLAVAACRRISTPAAAEPLVSHRGTQGRYNSSLVDVSGGFDEMLASTQRQMYYVFVGKGGVGKTSMAASLAVKFANRGEPTFIASTDPTRSLGDSFEQDISDCKLYASMGLTLFLQLRLAVLVVDLGSRIRWQGLGLEHFLVCVFPFKIGNSELDGMLNRLPPGFEESFAISELIKSVELQGPDKFRCIVLDTASTGHTLELLSATSWIEKFLSLTIKAVNTGSFTSVLKSAFGKELVDSARLEELRKQTARFEELRKQAARVRELLYDPQSTEFIIVTIPTEQARAFSVIREDDKLGDLKLIQAPLLDVEVKGVPALRFLSDSAWK